MDALATSLVPGIYFSLCICQPMQEGFQIGGHSNLYYVVKPEQAEIYDLSNVVLILIDIPRFVPFFLRPKKGTWM